MGWKLATFNVNGIRARLAGLLTWLREAAPDVVCLQETKAQEADFPAAPLRELGYHVAYRGQKSFNGVAILSRRPAGKVVAEMAGDRGEARFLALEVDGVRVVNTYVPQGREVGDPAFAFKLGFFDSLGEWLGANCTPDQPLVWAGDLNVAPSDLDLFDPKRLAGGVGCHPDERAALQRVVGWGFSDCFRLRHPEEKQFTFWDYRLPGSFKRNLGWRIDMVMATAPLAAACAASGVDAEPRGREKPSDHTPVWAEFDL